LSGIFIVISPDFPSKIFVFPRLSQPIKFPARLFPPMCRNPEQCAAVTLVDVPKSANRASGVTLYTDRVRETRRDQTGQADTRSSSTRRRRQTIQTDNEQPPAANC